jgi:hypothetical protein
LSSVKFVISVRIQTKLGRLYECYLNFALSITCNMFTAVLNLLHANLIGTALRLSVKNKKKDKIDIGCKREMWKTVWYRYHEKKNRDKDAETVNAKGWKNVARNDKAWNTWKWTSITEDLILYKKYFRENYMMCALLQIVLSTKSKLIIVLLSTLY